MLKFFNYNIPTLPFQPEVSGEYSFSLNIVPVFETRPGQRKKMFSLFNKCDSLSIFCGFSAIISFITVLASIS